MPFVFFVNWRYLKWRWKWISQIEEIEVEDVKKDVVGKLVDGHP
jgi:ribosomal protein L20A (L18A)